MDFDDVFTIPEVEAAESHVIKKRKRDKRLEAFEVLREVPMPGSGLLRRTYILRWKGGMSFIG